MKSVRVERDFVVALLRYADAEERWRLLERVEAAEREEQRSRLALFVTALVAASLCVGLSFLARDVLAELENVSLTLLDVLSAVAAFSGFVLVVVSGSWLWTRGVVHRMRDEVTRFVLGLIESRFRTADEGA